MVGQKEAIEAKIQMERTLIRCALDGDGEAFNRLYQQYHHQILATLLGRTRNRHDAEDLLQVTFLYAYRDLASFRGESTFLTWLMQIAINVCMTHLRAKQARRSWHETIETPQLGYRDIWEPASMEHPDDALNRKECHKILEDCISKLPQQYHSVVRMRYVQDRSYVEISHELGVPMSTLKTWLYRARRQLQETLNETEFVTM